MLELLKTLRILIPQMFTLIQVCGYSNQKGLCEKLYMEHCKSWLRDTDSAEEGSFKLKKLLKCDAAVEPYEHQQTRFGKDVEMIVKGRNCSIVSKITQYPELQSLKSSQREKCPKEEASQVSVLRVIIVEHPSYCIKELIL